jgi:hypothetical protein
MYFLNTRRMNECVEHATLAPHKRKEEVMVKKFGCWPMKE